MTTPVDVKGILKVDVYPAFNAHIAWQDAADLFRTLGFIACGFTLAGAAYHAPPAAFLSALTFQASAFVCNKLCGTRSARYLGVYARNLDAFVAKYGAGALTQ